MCLRCDMQLESLDDHGRGTSPSIANARHSLLSRFEVVYQVAQDTGTRHADGVAQGYST